MATIEIEVRQQIDKRLEAQGWILDVSRPDRNVFFESAVNKHLSKIVRGKLKDQKPDYTFFINGRPIAVLEAKRPNVSIRNAIDQGVGYAKLMGIDYVFACNGPVFKSYHIPSGEPMSYNNVEIDSPPSPNKLKEFFESEIGTILKVAMHTIENKDQLIGIFEELNDMLRRDGIRAGLTRFTEFANILFLKMLSERKKDHGIWNNLTIKNPKEIKSYINNYVYKELRNQYNGDVISKTTIGGKALSEMINEINPLSLMSVDEDVKGAAFEHFLGKTTAIGNDLGEYFTPRKYIDFTLRLVNPQFGDSVCDPFCGTGGFLVQAFTFLSNQVKHTKQNSKKLTKESIFGQEITETANIAKMNMILFGDGNSGIKRIDSLASGKQVRQYDCILSNIPFSQKISEVDVKRIHPFAANADGACLLQCFNMLKDGGSMGVIIPHGLLFNKSNREMWNWIYTNSKVRALVELPRGAFAPYTDAASVILYVTDKGIKRTDWCYFTKLSDEENLDSTVDANDFLYFFGDNNDLSNIMRGVHIVYPENGEFLRPWTFSIGADCDFVLLRDVAQIDKGIMLTKKDSTSGFYPVIGGGAGTVPFTHEEFNQNGGCFTISGSGAYAGFAWWHESPIWASDCLVVRSSNEKEYLSFYLYMCVKSRQEELYDRQTGTGQPHIYKRDIIDFPIPEITIDKQKMIIERTLSLKKKRIKAENDEKDEMRNSIDQVRSLYRR